jgi:hypothetical protein
MAAVEVLPGRHCFGIAVPPTLLGSLAAVASMGLAPCRSERQEMRKRLQRSGLILFDPGKEKGREPFSGNQNARPT